MNRLCSDFIPGKGRVCAIGIFDGVHLGHQILLKEALRISKSHDLLPSVITFHPHPASVVAGISVPLIMPIDMRIRHIKAMGIEDVCVVRFTKAFAGKTAGEFAEGLSSLSVRHIVVGEDFRCGRDNISGAGLKTAFDRRSIGVSFVKNVCLGDERISSQRIRQALRDGNMESAAEMLGRFPIIYGTVKKGRRIGRKLGFPTANLDAENLGVFRKGSYIAKAIVNSRPFWGLLFVGKRPTFNGRKLKAEIYLLNFKDMLYNSPVEIEVVNFIRDEVKFSSIEDLKNSIKRDEHILKEYISTRQGAWF